MAYRRRQGIQRASTFKEEIYRRHADEDGDFSNSSSTTSSNSSSSLAAQAIRASADRAHSSFHSSFNDRSNKGAPVYDNASMRSSTDAGGFWGVLARKAKAILEDDNLSNHSDNRMINPNVSSSIDGQFYQTYQPAENSRKMDNPRFRKGLDALATSLNHIGDTIGNALEEGRTIVESKTADIIQETRKLQNRRRDMNSGEPNQVSGTWQQQSPAQPYMQTSQEDQIKASRDVAMATAAKAKLLLRELKTVKADLAFAKQRCSQLEEENRILREARAKGDNPADDDMIRLQLETLLAEKARLATENSVYARENRFLREIVEYHQLTMQDVVYLDEGIEEVTEVGGSRVLSASPSLSSLYSPPDTSPSISRSSSAVAKELMSLPEVLKTTVEDVPDSQEAILPSSTTSPPPVLKESK
ncbi:hypothetical protein M9H77_22233 [Catharanthus roseus]|uniref:Uncharacterized protein n=1 Tax=Catharanthus roseus TaxID=4058 RepID=A0ACC0ARD2_CATRO|nr:hypothetical protein M9H77_22233 [Catharanthus roseus]